MNRTRVPVPVSFELDVRQTIRASSRLAARGSLKDQGLDYATPHHTRRDHRARPDSPPTKAEQLQDAARKGDAATVKKLLDEGVDVNTKFRYNATALFYACDHGHLEVVKVLLDTAPT